MKLPAITFNQQALTNFKDLIEKEWLITNGIGGYASSTVLGINTRKYHGLLVAALNPPGDRMVCLSKLDEDLIYGNQIFRLGSNEFNDTIYPQGYKLIKQFSISPFPTYTYGLNGLEVSKTVFMPKLKNAVCTIYKVNNQSGTDAKLSIYPMVNCRYYHNVTDRHRNPLHLTQQQNSKEVELTFHEQNTTLTCRITDGVFNEKGNWVDRLLYRDEEFRGESSNDDCYQPGTFEVTVPAESETTFALTTAASRDSQENRQILDSIGSSVDQATEAYNHELAHLSDLILGFYQLHKEVPMTDWLNWILQAADAFIVQNSQKRKSIIAGYHWFEPWGRDTFISLPGLMLVTGRFSDAEDIFLNFIQYCSDGLIPNYIADKSAQPSYNTVDGTLWYINAVLQYLKYTGNFAYVKQNLWETLKSIISNHEKGTLFNIHLDSDGLLAHGSRLTWMDAFVDGEDVTPRHGKAVEIQALWYNALKTMELLAHKYEETDLAEHYAEIAEKAHVSFNQKFWNPKNGYLNDVVDTSGADASIRPNQILAVSLDFSMVNKTVGKQIVDFVNNQLVTPYGLRTLSLDDPKFVGKCEGNRRSRDTAYHNGTIWPWLLGPFITAYLKVYGDDSETHKLALQNFVLPLLGQTIHHGCLGSINEIFDCDPPNEPRGAIAQAWSVAELLRAYVEDVLGIEPILESVEAKLL
ncbi:MAG: amylo-alpha-1,6-glucosidase [Candidatus Bathyarchaeia archaeon]|jgi:predicted glycogen debranching enzyme